MAVGVMWVARTWGFSAQGPELLLQLVAIAGIGA
jgi:hypothetical protein